MACGRYRQQVCSLGAFSWYCGDELLARGGSALLEKELVRIILPTLQAARRQSDIPRCACTNFDLTSVPSIHRGAPCH